MESEKHDGLYMMLGLTKAMMKQDDWVSEEIQDDIVVIDQ